LFIRKKFFMKKCSLLFIVVVLVCDPLFAQETTCDVREQKVFFEGQAPAPWAIDGRADDWRTILGAYTGNPLQPYNPLEVGSNWSIDGIVGSSLNDLDTPAAKDDIRYFAITNDDYNVYFYARRTTNSGDMNSLFYFIDINADGFMTNGEPVLTAQFNGKKVVQLSLGQYVVNTEEDFQPTAGNYMTSPPPSTNLGFADGYTITGKVAIMFSAQKIPQRVALLPGEVFDAAVTEDGYGIEISIPWRFLRNWAQNTNILQANNIFTYHIAFQNGGGPYLAQKVVDNAGGCCGGIAVSGNASVAVSNLKSSAVVAGTTYRFSFTYTNNTNIDEQVGLGQIFMDQFNVLTGATPDYQSFTLTAYRDDNCSGASEEGERRAAYTFHNDLTQGQIVYHAVTSLATNVKPGASICFVVDLTILPGIFSGFSIYFTPDVKFNLPVVSCFGPSILEGGKPINPAAFSIETGFFTSGRVPGAQEKEALMGKAVQVFPNPSKGAFEIRLPDTNPRDIYLLDYSGRLVKQWKGNQARSLSVNQLTKGIYLLRIADVSEKRKVEVKKVVVQ
jgi:hypothetical protein